MLTPEQLEARRRTIGASEIAAIAGLDRRREAVDVWARKYRGPELDVPPVVVDEEPEPDEPLAVAGRLDTDPRVLGHLFEDAIAQAYAHRTGHSAVLWQGTITHPNYHWATCTPDGHVNGKSGGLEIKLVGEWMRGDWPSDGVPPYVVTQCQWSMGVTDLPWWDVAALVGGTDLRIHRVERDDQLIDDLFEIGRSFWHDFVLANVMPKASSGKAALRVLLERWREDDGTTLELDGDEDVNAVVEGLVVAQQQAKEAKARVDEYTAVLCARTGIHKSIAGHWGRFDWSSRQGSPSWRKIAEELAGGNVSNELLEKYRGKAFRSPRLFPHREWKKRLLEEMTNE